MYNLFSMTKIRSLFVSHYDFSHIEFKLKSIHTLYFITISVIQNSKGDLVERREEKFQKRILSAARQLPFQATPVNTPSHVTELNPYYTKLIPFLIDRFF